VRKGTRWEPLLQDRASAATESFDAMETIADRILSADAPADARREGILDRETLCYPLHAGGAVVGMLGVENAAALPAGERKALGAAAAVMAIAVRNVQLILATQEESMRDSLTGCFTRKYALDQLDRCMRLSRRSARPLSIVMFDIDRFKQVNDELGHLRGDELLRAVGQKLTSVLRSTDFRCRYGGDEFMIICPDTPVLGAQQVAECLRREIATLAIDANGTAQRVSASFGVAADVAGNEIDVEALIQRADAELYRAKHAGRNRVCVAADAATSPKVEQIAARPRFISAVS
jgi:diguanylate cyclase (GGDEF)-like protein